MTTLPEITGDAAKIAKATERRARLFASWSAQRPEIVAQLAAAPVGAKTADKARARLALVDAAFERGTDARAWLDVMVSSQDDGWAQLLIGSEWDVRGIVALAK